MKTDSRKDILESIEIARQRVLKARQVLRAAEARLDFERQAMAQLMDLLRDEKVT